MLSPRLAAPVAALLAVATAAPAADRSPDALIEAARAGGHVLFIRHAATETDWADQVSAVMGDCSTQRMLGREGWAQARALGAAFRLHGIPVGAVVSSEYCRAWQTADLAFGRFETAPALNFEPAEEYTHEQTERMRARMTPLLAAPPPAGVNTVLVGHDDPFEAATGVYPEPMGVTFVLRPDGAGGFEVLGSIAPDAWPAPGG
jgi:phosphohistidine phosphatase SixA